MKRQPDVKEVIPLEDIYMFSSVPAQEKGDFFLDRVPFIYSYALIFSKFDVITGPERNDERLARERRSKLGSL